MPAARRAPTRPWRANGRARWTIDSSCSTARDARGTPIYHTNVRHEHRHAHRGGGARQHRRRPTAARGRAGSALGRELLAIDHAEMRAFAGNMLEVGSWDEYLGDFAHPGRCRPPRSARCATRKYARLYASVDAVLAVPDRRDRAARRRQRPLYARGSFPGLKLRSAMDFCLKVLLAYLLGSVVGSLVVGRLRGGVDIRTLGSGNAGGTNALRTQGAGVRASGSSSSTSPRAGSRPRCCRGSRMPGRRARRRDRSPEWLPAACAFAAILGHVFPVWHGFRGGKGVATLVGALCRHRAGAAAAAVRELARGGHGVGLRRPGVDHRGAAPCRSIYCCVTARS